MALSPASTCPNNLICLLALPEARAIVVTAFGGGAGATVWATGAGLEVKCHSAIPPPPNNKVANNQLDSLLLFLFLVSGGTVFVSCSVD